MTKTRPLITRILDGIADEPGPGCWLWRKGLDGCGYGRIQVAGRKGFAHRVSYEVFVGPIPDGLTIDHLCNQRSCVNPNHLEPVTLAENKRRAVERRTHCLSGRHEFTPENTYYDHGKRRCRACQREAVRRYVAKKKGAVR